MTTAKNNEYKSWDEIDFAIKYLAEKKLALKQLEIEREKEINEITKKNYFEIEILKETIAATETRIQDFVKANIADFKDSKTKKFGFGKISITTAKSLVINCAEFAIKKLKELKLGHLVTEKPELKKNDLKKLDAKTLQQIGAYLSTEDNIKIETKI